MKLIFTSILFFLLVVNGFGQKIRESEWKSLLSKDMSGWETYLGRPDQNNKQQASIGKNKDPNGVFSIIEESGEPVLRISGETFGGINTLEEFENYHLRLEFKWGNKKWPPKLNDPMDSGLLYHSIGEYGSSFLWMKSFEFQIQEGDCGDYWGVMDVLADIEAVKNEKGKYVYQKGASSVTFRDKTPVGRSCLKSQTSEMKAGEWNVLDLYCFGGTAVHVMNGKVNMVLRNTRHMVDGKEVPLTKGKIQFQSEGSEIFYRNIRVRSITALPK